MEIEGVDLWTIRDGRIAVYRAFYDMNDLVRQLGLAPPPGSRARAGDGGAAAGAGRDAAPPAVMKGDFDAVIVGGSVAGCAAARLYAQRGARVALVERRPDIDAYKTVCTHYIQPSATPTLERLGLAGDLDARGAVRNSIDLWTPYGGWIRHRQDTPYGYNVTPPDARPDAAAARGRDAGRRAADGLDRDRRARQRPPRPASSAEDRAPARRELRAPLVVAADGRGSRIARLTRTPGRVRPHNRFFYWAYWRGVPADGDALAHVVHGARLRVHVPQRGRALTVILVGPHRDRLPEFRRDAEGAYLRMLESLPDAPDLSRATRESKLIGKLDVPNVSRPAARPGLAFVGDAALASDPLWGVGCGWALQSAEWLVDETADALDRRRRPRRARSRPTAACTASASARTTSCSPTSPPAGAANPLERRLYRAAVTDDDVFHAFEAIGSRRASPGTLFAPRTMWRIARAA